VPRFFTGDFKFKGLAARRLYKSFGVKGLTSVLLGDSFAFHSHLHSPLPPCSGQIIVVFVTKLYSELSNNCSAMNVGPCHHGMERPQVADGGTASNMEGSC
jgi:hypothetical protein